MKNGRSVDWGMSLDSKENGRLLGSYAGRRRSKKRKMEEEREDLHTDQRIGPMVPVLS